MSTRVVSLAGRPDLAPARWALPDLWPRFPVAGPGERRRLFDLLPVRYPELPLLALDRDRVLARVNAVPMLESGQDEDLPGGGWDHAPGLAFRPGTPAGATAVSPIGARIHPDARIRHPVRARAR